MKSKHSMLPTTFLSPLLTLALAFVAFGQNESVLIDPKQLPVIPSVWITPSTTPADSVFKLKLVNSQFQCNTQFSDVKAKVDGGKIFLTYFAYNNPAIRCMDPSLAPDGGYGPTFKMPGLPAGKYAIYDWRIMPCVKAGTCEAIYAEVPVDTLSVIGSRQPKYIVSPTKAKAGQEFTLSVLSYDFTCATQFSHKQIHVSEGEIFLSFLPTTNPAVLCPMVYKPYGPSFKAPALKAGTYKVYASRLIPCMVSEPACKIAIIPELAGTVTVEGASTHEMKYTIAPKQVKANTVFTLDLLNSAYGNCQTSFAHTTSSVAEGKIVLSFLVENHPERVCVWNKTPFGPSYEIEPLKAGKYAVYAYEHPDCYPCKMMGTLTLVDSLTVGGTPLGLRQSLSEGNRSSATLSGRQVRLSLDLAKAGMTRTELYAPTGKRIAVLNEERLSAGHHEQVLATPKLERGVYLLKIVLPDGAARMHTLRQLDR